MRAISGGPEQRLSRTKPGDLPILAPLTGGMTAVPHFFVALLGRAT